MKEILIVGVGGFIGAVCRYLFGLIPLKEPHIFPFKTFAVNVTGCILIGIIAVLAQRHFSSDSPLILFLKTGVCGGFTTFSTFALETSAMFHSGNNSVAFLYVILSVGIGVGVIWLTTCIFP